MQLRLLQYVGDLYSGYISKNKFNKYGKTLIGLPTPKLVVFYNGEDDKEDESILRLSDAFSVNTREQADIEVVVLMINVNHGRNKKLMNACKPLAEYSWFINEIRENQKKGHKLETAVNTALDAMPKDYLIRSFLMLHKQEVQGMLDTEYNEAEVMELFREDGRKEGREEGKKEGIKEGIKEGKETRTRDINTLNTWLFDSGRVDDVRRAATDDAFMKELFKEYNKCHETKILL